MKPILKRAFQYCKKNKHQLTARREQVLSLLASRTTPMGAYEILDSLSTKYHKVSPPTVYRAIDFWVESGFIHKIDSTNSYVACQNDSTHGNSLIMICDVCHKVHEMTLSQLPSIIRKAANSLNFKPHNTTFEMPGYCKDCNPI